MKKGLRRCRGGFETRPYGYGVGTIDLIRKGLQRRENAEVREGDVKNGCNLNSAFSVPHSAFSAYDIYEEEQIMSIDSSQIDCCVNIAHKFGAKKLILFGSAVESPETARDLDIACDGVDGWGIFELGAQIEEEIGIPVDIVPLQPITRFTQYITKKGRVLYEH